MTARKDGINRGVFMKYINRVTLVGYISKIEMGKTGAGTIVANFTVVTEKDVPSRGALKTVKEFHTCRCFAKAAEVFGNLASIFDEIFVDGEIQTSAYVDANGISREQKEINAVVFNIFKKNKPAIENNFNDELFDDDLDNGGNF
jgi:single stranded DNA-binding protein